ncbi:putative leader peptide [Amycolatopsis sp. NBC_01286]|uniref:putative leader peptide n=1 Tax=Amycolatopsis sp. NBC_01286 TaxID=2903560 RepID=UPI003FA39C6A
MWRGRDAGQAPSDCPPRLGRTPAEGPFGSTPLTAPPPAPSRTRATALSGPDRPGRRAVDTDCGGPGASQAQVAGPPGGAFSLVSDPSPTIRTGLDHIVDAWHAERVTSAGVLLVARRHVDLLRVASALCVPVR